MLPWLDKRMQPSCIAPGAYPLGWGGAGVSVVTALQGSDAERRVRMQVARFSCFRVVDRVDVRAHAARRRVRSGGFRAGHARPPRPEADLGKHGLTLGHFPQSWELATVGGWVATRSSGQESLGYGRIEQMVAGLELVSPGGACRLPALPASTAGPDLRQLVMGSEGRLGIITEVTLRVRPRPRKTVVDAYLVPNVERGMEAVRELVRSNLPLCMLRLSDAPRDPGGDGRRPGFLVLRAPRAAVPQAAWDR